MIKSRQKPREEIKKMNKKTESLGEVSNPSFNEDLKAENERLKVLLKKLETQQQKEQKKEETKPEVAEDIMPNEFIKVMSLVNNKMNLRTSKDGKLFTFERFGETKKILFSDLLEINNHHRNFLEAGYYVILDDRVILSEGLSDIYGKILTKEQIERILSNKEDAISLFQKANPKQQEVIVKVIVDKVLNNETVDYNLINDIFRVSGIDINARVKNTQEILQAAQAN